MAHFSIMDGKILNDDFEQLYETDIRNTSL